MDAAQGYMPNKVPVAVCLYPAKWRISPQQCWGIVAGPSARLLLCRLSLGAHGSVVCRRCDEYALDGCDRSCHPLGKDCHQWTFDGASSWRGFIAAGVWWLL